MVYEVTRKTLFFFVASAMVLAQTFLFNPPQTVQAVEEPGCENPVASEVKTPVQLPETVVQNGLTTSTVTQADVGSFTATLGAWDANDQGYVRFTFDSSMDISMYHSLELTLHGEVLQGDLGEAPVSLQFYDNEWTAGASVIVPVDASIISDTDVVVTVPLSHFSSPAFTAESLQHILFLLPKTGKSQLHLSVASMNWVKTELVCEDTTQQEEEGNEESEEEIPTNVVPEVPEPVIPLPLVCSGPATNAFTGCYYNNSDHTDLVVVRTDSEINFNFATGSPDPAIDPNTFSVVWKGEFTFSSGTYNFTAVTDDGMQVYVDGVMVLDKYFNQAETEYQFPYEMTAGEHLIEVKYYENLGKSVAKLSWELEPPVGPLCGAPGTEAFTACYYNNMDVTDLQVVQTEPAVNMDVGMGSPDSSVEPDTFSVVWKGIFTFATGTYKFTAITDDGMQVYIDGVLLLDKYFDQPETVYEFTEDLAGEHLIEVKYYENEGDAVAQLSWEMMGDLMIDDTITSDAASYTAGDPVEVTAMITSNQTLLNANIDLELYNSSDVMVDQQIVPADLLAGVAKEVVWNLSAPITPGEYQVKLGVFASDWSALYHWDNVGTTFTVSSSGGLVCGPAASGAFTACYYDNQDFTNLAVVRTDPTINNDWGGGSPDPAVQPDTFSAHWKGNFTFDAAEYTFTAVTDDGMQIWIDGVLVLDKYFDQSATTYTFNETMTSGTHMIEVKYYEHGGDAVAKLSWEKAGVVPSCGVPGSETFTGCYYDNQNFTDLKVVRNDPMIDFDWGGGSPDASIAPDTFSVAWAGNFMFSSGTHQFTARTDDGMRVKIDGDVVLDKFYDQPPTTHIFTAELSAGVHLVEVEYYENGGGAVAELSWTDVSVEPDDIVVLQPTDGSTVSGVVEVRAYVEGRDLSDYTLGWRVNGSGPYTSLIDDPSGDYKHNYIDFSGWNWEADNMYDLEFQAKNLSDVVIDTETITVIH